MTIDLMDSRRIDFNLATVFLALWRERNVTKAAARLGLSQAATSAALGRLRELCQDELFVRTKAAMTPTLRANEMSGRLEQHLMGLQEALRTPIPFEPERAERQFTIGMSDDYEVALGPMLLQRVTREAPHITLLFRQTNRHLVEGMLERRELDLAVVADPPRHAWLLEEAIGMSGYSCLLDAKQCRVSLPVTLEDYLRLPHVLVSYSGRRGLVDTALQRIQRKRRIKASLTHFVALPSFLSGLEAIATLPSHAARALAKGTRLRVSTPPIRLESYAVEVVARRDMTGDAGLQWLRERIRECAKRIFC